MKIIKTKYGFIDLIQILSIDIVFGSLSIGYMAVKLLQVDANPYWWLILATTVWVVYSLDHIIDGFKNDEKATIERHRFHYRFRKQIVILMIIASLISIVLSFVFLDMKIIIWGVLLSLFIAIYLFILYILKKRRTVLFQKELIIAIVYTTGIFLAPIVWYGKTPPYPILIIISLIFILVWLEGIMISWFDYENDIKDSHTSFTVLFGKKKTRRFVILGHALVEVITVFVLVIYPVDLRFWVFLIIFLMNLILGLTIMFPRFFANNSYYRIIGETVFLLPFLLVIAS